MTGQVKLTVEQALRIRRLYESTGPDEAGAGRASLAAQFRVSVQTVHRILTGEHPLVKGVPNISGMRTSLEGGHTPALDGLSKGTRRLLAAAPRKSQREYRQRECPDCYARKGEYCTNLHNGRDRANVHDGRRTG